jgi:hypothetical protein|tara:strand:+ start:197 stop:475 length:279 start_codon:yes stop_codon:yes gene_type:complete
MTNKLPTNQKQEVKRLSTDSGVFNDIYNKHYNLKPIISYASLDDVVVYDKQLIESINDDSLSELTKKTMEDSKKGKNLHQYNSTKEMFDELT